MAHELEALSGDQIPKAYGIIVTRCSQGPPVRREDRREDVIGVPPQGPLVRAFHVPDSYGIRVGEGRHM